MGTARGTVLVPRHVPTATVSKGVLYTEGSENLMS